MTRVIATATVSLDGFIADTSDAVATADNITGQLLEAGLVDDLVLNLVPVVFGTGIRFFGDYTGRQQLFEDPTVIQGDRVTHLHYRIR